MRKPWHTQCTCSAFSPILLLVAWCDCERGKFQQTTQSTLGPSSDRLEPGGKSLHPAGDQCPDLILLWLEHWRRTAPVSSVCTVGSQFIWPSMKQASSPVFPWGCLTPPRTLRKLVCSDGAFMLKVGTKRNTGYIVIRRDGNRKPPQHSIWVVPGRSTRRALWAQVLLPLTSPYSRSGLI